MDTKININHVFNRIQEHWKPETVARLNGQEVKIAKVDGVFPWHVHEQEDELFLVWKGILRIEFRDSLVELKEGEAYVVKRGIEHRTAADTEAWIMMFEPAGVRNTGNVYDARFTALTES